MKITKEQLRRFLLVRHGLMGEHIFSGDTGIMDFIRIVGCIQYDPVDVVGRNADLTLQSRIPKYKKSMLESLLYKERRLVDGYDKMMAIYPVEDWQYLSPRRASFDHPMRDIREDEIMEAYEYLKNKPFFSSSDLETDAHISWGYNSAPKSRAILDVLFYRGNTIIHHKKGTQRFFTDRMPHFPADCNPFTDDEAMFDWFIYRRIGAVGVMWNKQSDLWVSIPRFKNRFRDASFKRLCDKNLIQPIEVEGIDTQLYIRSIDLSLLQETLEGSYKNRLEFIAPLDPLIWDRNIIDAVFDFNYRWEIYTPVHKRKYGHYVLPMVYNETFIGRIELKIVEDELKVMNIWYESNKCVPKHILMPRLKQFARFNGVVYK